MPIRFTPDLIPRYDETFLRYVNENFQRLKSLLGTAGPEHISGTAPADPYIGQTWVDTTTKAYRLWNGTLWKYIHSYEKLDFSPTIQQPGLLTRTISYANYQRGGDYVEGEILLVVTGTGTANNIINISLPVTPAAVAGQAAGYGYLYDASANVRYPCQPVITSSTLMAFIDPAGGVGVLFGQTGAAFGAALALNDTFTYNFRYRANV